MKACIPVAQDRGLESRVHAHFGSAPVFLIVDTDTRATRAIANPEREHGRCHPLDLLAEEKFDLVLVSAIGAGALERLSARCLPVYRAGRGTVGEALEAVARGDLPPVLPGDASAGGSGRGRHRHGRPGGAGPGADRFRRSGRS